MQLPNKHTNPISMSSQANLKNKAVMGQEEEIVSSGEGERRMMVRRNLSHGDDLRRTEGLGTEPGYEGPPITTWTKTGQDGLEMVVPFPMADDAVVLDLSQARMAMKTSWTAVGRFASVLPFSTDSLFKDMKSKWRLRGTVDYQQLRHNRFLLEFKREADLRFVLNNGL